MFTICLPLWKHAACQALSGLAGPRPFAQTSVVLRRQPLL
jgi:hypothetical protein